VEVARTDVTVEARVSSGRVTCAVALGIAGVFVAGWVDAGLACCNGVMVDVTTVEAGAGTVGVAWSQAESTIKSSAARPAAKCRVRGGRGLLERVM
jgi:hypothetical protein